MRKVRASFTLDESHVRKMKSRPGINWSQEVRTMIDRNYYKTSDPKRLDEIREQATKLEAEAEECLKKAGMLRYRQKVLEKKQSDLAYQLIDSMHNVVDTCTELPTGLVDKICALGNFERHEFEAILEQRNPAAYWKYCELKKNELYTELLKRERDIV